jgi:palmitoyl-protein thioesterase
LEKNRFLPDLNNERRVNPKYKENISLLDRFVLIRFSEDVMIKPGYTAVSMQIYTKQGVNLIV